MSEREQKPDEPDGGPDDSINNGMLSKRLLELMSKRKKNPKDHAEMKQIAEMLAGADGSDGGDDRGGCAGGDGDGAGGGGGGRGKGKGGSRERKKSDREGKGKRKKRAREEEDEEEEVNEDDGQKASRLEGQLSHLINQFENDKRLAAQRSFKNPRCATAHGIVQFYGFVIEKIVECASKGASKRMTDWLKFVAEFGDVHAVGNRSEDEDGNHRELIRRLLEHIRSQVPVKEAKAELSKLLCPNVSVTDGFCHYTATDYLDPSIDAKYVKWEKEQFDRKVVETIQQRQRAYLSSLPPTSSGSGSSGNTSSAAELDSVLAAAMATSRAVPGADLGNVRRTMPRLGNAGVSYGYGGFARGSGASMGIGGGGSGACNHCGVVGHFWRSCPTLQAQQAGPSQRAIMPPAEMMHATAGGFPTPAAVRPPVHQFTPSGYGFRGGLGPGVGLGPRPV